MDGLSLLRRARNAGLAVEEEVGKLVIRGPRRAEPVARLLIEHKPQVLAALAPAQCSPRHTGIASPNPVVDPAPWRDQFYERVAIRMHEDGYPRAEAECLAFGRIILEWHLKHGARADPRRCAGCGEEASGEGSFVLLDGARLHLDGFRSIDCIIRYGAKWRSAAVDALRLLGVAPPQHFQIL
jgi:hypothetical protein